MVELVKKSVAIGIAGLTAVVVAAWRQVQRDNTLATDATGPAPSPPSEPDEAPPGSAAADSVNESSSKAELYEVAQELEIEGRSTMNKTELLEAIRTAS